MPHFPCPSCGCSMVYAPLPDEIFDARECVLCGFYASQCCESGSYYTSGCSMRGYTVDGEWTLCAEDGEWYFDPA